MANYHKQYKITTKYPKKCVTARAKRVHHVHAVLLERRENDAQIAVSVQRPVEQERLKESKSKPFSLPLRRGERVSRLLTLLVVTLGMGTSLLFLSVIPYHNRSASMDELLAPIRHLPLWHMAVIVHLIPLGGFILSRFMVSR
jgi:hypothetical protein